MVPGPRQVFACCRYVDDTGESTTHRQQTQEALRTHPVCAAGDQREVS